MKLTTASLLALSAAAVNARFVEQHEKDQVFINGYTSDNEKYLLELAPGKTQWATEEEKWELRRVSLPIDIFLSAADMLKGGRQLHGYHDYTRAGLT